MPHRLTLTVLVEVRCDGRRCDGKIFFEKAQQINAPIRILVLNCEEFHAVTGGKDEALADTRLVDERARCIGEASCGDGQSFSDFNRSRSVVDADEDEMVIGAHGVVNRWTAEN